MGELRTKKVGKRGVALLLIAAMMLTLVLAGLPVEEAKAAQQKVSMDENAYQALGFETDAENPEEGYFGNGNTVLTTQNEVFYDINGSSNYGFVLRDNIYTYRDDIGSDSLEEAGAYRMYGQYHNDDWAKLKSKNGYNYGRSGGQTIGSNLVSKNTHKSRVYATSTEFKSASGREDRVAQLYITASTNRSGFKVYLEIIKFNKSGSGYTTACTSTVGLGSPAALDEAGYWYNEQYDALFEVTAGDYDGDGVDEVAVYYGDNTVKIYKTANDRLTLWQTISSGEILADTGVRMSSTDSSANSGKNMAAVVSLASGDLQKDFTEDLVIGVSMPKVLKANDNNNAFIYGYDKESGKMAKDETIGLNGIGNENTSLLAVNVAVGDLDGNGRSELVIGGRTCETITQQYPAWTWKSYRNIAAIHVEYNFNTKSYDALSPQIFTEGINNTLFNTTLSGPGYTAPVGLAICNFGTSGNPAQRLYLFDQLYSYNTGMFVRQDFGLNFCISQKNNDNKSVDKDAVWISKIVSGSFAENANGSEQLAAIIGVKEKGQDKYWYQVCYISMRGNKWYHSWEGILNQATSYLNQSNKPRASAYVSFSLPDVDDDSAVLKYMGAETYYTKPEVQAVLQSSPYFQDVADVYDDYLDDGSTAYGTGEGSGNATTASIEASAGVYASAEASLFVAVEWESTISANTSYEHQTSWEVSTSVEYAGNAGDDYVVMYTIPYHRYWYSFVDENGEEQYLTIEEPMTPATVIVPVDTYDSMTEIYEGLEPIRGNLIKSTPGDPSTYTNTFGSKYTSIGSTQLLTNAGSNSGSSVSVSREATVGNEESFSVGTEVEMKAGVGAGFLGNDGKAGTVMSIAYSAGYVHSHMNGVTYSGTVDNLPSGVSGYGFNWQFGAQETKLNDESVVLIGYQLSNVKEAPKPATNLAITEITSRTMTLEWDGTASASAYELMLITNNGMELPQATIPSTQAKSDGSMEYKVTDLTPNTQYSYKVVAVDGTGARSISSRTVSGTTLSEDDSGFKITKQPEDTEVHIGGTAVFEIETENNTDKVLNYRWQTYDASAKSWNFMSNGYNRRLSVKGDADLDGTKYRCIVYTGGTLLTSTVANLTIGKSDSETLLTVRDGSDKILQNNAVVKASETQTEDVKTGTIDVPYTVTVEQDGVVYTKVQDDGGHVLWMTTDAEGNSHYYANESVNGKDDPATGEDKELGIQSQYTFVTYKEAEGSENGDLAVDQSFHTGARTDTPSGVAAPSGIVVGSWIGCYEVIAEGDVKEYIFEASVTEQEEEVTKYYDKNGTEVYLYDVRSMISVDANTTVNAFDLTDVEEMRTEDVVEQQQKIVSGDRLTFTAEVKDGNQSVTDTPPSFQIVDTSNGVSTTVASKAAQDAYTASYTFSQPGIYQIIAVYAGSESYNASRSESITLIVQGTAKQLHIAGGTMTYGETMDLNPTILSSGGETAGRNIKYTVKKGGETLTADRAGIFGNMFTPESAGTYQITAEDKEQNLSAISEIIVSKRTLTVTPVNVEANVNDSQEEKKQKLDATKSFVYTEDVGKVFVQGLAENDSISYSLNSEALTANRIGDYPITVNDVSSVSGDNYTIVLNRSVYTLTQDRVQVTASAGTNGLIRLRYQVSEDVQPIEIESGTYIPKGAKFTATAQPSTGFGVEKWTVDGEKIDGTDTEYVVDALNDNIDISVSFSYKYNTLTYGSVGDGAIDGVYEGSGQTPFTSGDKLNQRQSVVLTATPADGYAVDYWEIRKGVGEWETIKAEDEKSNYTQNTYTVSDVNEDTQVRVHFTAKKAHRITLQFKDRDNSQTTFSAGTGLKVNGNSVTAENNSYTYEGFEGDNLTLDITIPDNMLVDHWTSADGEGHETNIANNVKQLKLYDLDGDYTYVVYCSIPNQCQVEYDKVLDNTNLTGGEIEKAGTVTSDAGEASPVMLPQGADITFTAVPEKGYRISKWTVNDEVVTDNIMADDTDGSETYTMSVKGNDTVLVYFEKKPTVSYESDHASVIMNVGSETVANNSFVEFGSTVTWTITTEKDYAIDRVTLNGEDITENLSNASALDNVKYYTVENIQTNANLAVTFHRLETYTVNYSVVDTNNDGEGDFGKIEAAASRLGLETYREEKEAALEGSITVYEDGEVVLLPVPQSDDYRIKECMVNGEKIGLQPDGTIKLTSEQLAAMENKTAEVTVQFDVGAPVITFTEPVFNGETAGSITAVAAGTDLISGAAVDGTVTFRVTPDENYEVKEWLVNGVVAEGESENEFVYTNPSRIDSEVTAVLQGVPLNITAASEDEEGGTVEKLPEIIRYRDEVTLRAEPNTAYEFAGWYLGDEKVSEEAEYTFTAEEAASYIAKFAAKEVKQTFKINLEETEHGTIAATVNGEAVVSAEEGTEVTFTAVADASWNFGGWTVNGETKGEAETFTWIAGKDFTEDITVGALFTRAVYYEVSFGVESGNGTITGSADDGNISPDTVVQKVAGSSLTFNAKPEEGNMIAGWTINENPVKDLLTGELTVENLSEKTDVRVSFKPYKGYAIPQTTQSYIVKDINRMPSDTVPETEIREDGDVIFTIMPKEGFLFTKLELYGIDCLNVPYGEPQTVEAGNQESVVTVTKNDDGSYTVSIENVQKDIFIDGDIETAIVIDDAEVSVAGDQEFTYNGEEQVPSDLTVTLNGEIIPSGHYDVSCSNNKNARTATITVTGKDGYIGTALGTFEIRPKDLTITADDLSKSCAEEDPALTWQSEGLVLGDTVNVTIDRAAGEAPGVYEIRVKAEENPNYNITCKNGTFTITGSRVDISKAEVRCDQSFVYDKTDKTAAKLIVSLNGKTLTEDDYTVSYSDNRNAGTATITVTGTGAYTGVAYGSFVIAPRELVITANDMSKSYGYSDPQLAYQASGLISGDDVNVTLTRDPGENPGTYTIQVKAEAGSNYTVICRNGTFTIKNTKLNPALINKLNAGLGSSWSKDVLTVKWGTVSVADGYDVFVVECGKKFGKTPAATVKQGKTRVKLRKIAGKKPDSTKEYKILIKAFRMDNGKKTYIATSYSIHRAGKNSSSWTNAKKVTLKKTAYTLKAKQKAKIKVSIQKENSRKRLITHVSEKGKGVRYWSSNTKVAKVTKKGVIKAVSKGKCTIYVMADDGVKKRIKVTVKQ